jgi:hypothetical protein
MLRASLQVGEPGESIVQPTETDRMPTETRLTDRDLIVTLVLAHLKIGWYCQLYPKILARIVQTGLRHLFEETPPTHSGGEDVRLL